MPLLSAEERKNVINYKYHGGDSSPVYKYVLSPIAQFGVDYFTPLWMAPNVVTLLGLLVSATAALLTLIFNPTLSIDGPRWLHAVAGVSIFLYQTLDNMDGKQARRTGSSSALGMLFDHGCDAINAGLAALNMASVLGTGWTYKMFFPLTCGFIPFYFQTWEEYYLEAMILPVFNGPTEGLIMCMIVCFFSAWKGAVWFEQAPIELPSYLLLESDLLTSLHLPSSVNRFFTPLHIAMLIGYGTTYVTMFVQIGKVLVTLSSKGKSVIDPVVNLLPFLVFYPSIYYWCTHSEVAFTVHPLLTYVFINMVFVELIVHLMLMHICQGKLRPFDKIGPYVTALFPLYITFKPANASPVIEAAMIFVFAAYFSVNTITYLGEICTECAKTLNIFIFKLGKRSSE